MEKAHVQRVSYVVKALIKAGYRSLVSQLNLRMHLPFMHRNGRVAKKITTPVRVRRLLEDLGGAYVKLGQLLSLRPDLVPQAYSDEFKKLQDNVQPFPFHIAKRVIRDSLGKEPGTVFKSLRKTPLGSASIAQVHEAVLKTGEQVVVKVQRPNIKKKFELDIDVMQYVAQRMEKYMKHLAFSPLQVIKEFEKYTKEELNFTVEGRHIQQFHKDLNNKKYAKIPHYYEELSSSKILVMEKLEGVKLSTILKQKKKVDKHRIALHLFHLALRQIYMGDIFHADLHPGNIIVMKRGKIGLIDFGITGSLTPELREQGIRMYVALIDKDADEVYNSLMSMALVDENVDKEAFQREVTTIIDQWHGQSLKDARITHTLHLLLNSGRKFGIHMPVDMIILGKALVTLEGTAVALYPEFNFVEESKPYIIELLKEPFRMRVNMKRLLKSSFALRDYLRKFPQQAMSTLEAIEEGRFKIDIEDSDIQYLGESIDISSDRISLALVSASFVIAGSLILGVDVGPKYLGYPVLALISFGIAFLVVFILFIVLLQKVRFKYDKNA